MELDCCLPEPDSELLMPRQDPPLPDHQNPLTVLQGPPGSWERHQQQQIFCAVCQQFLEEPCWLHAKSVPNESVVPFAVASLPKILHLDACADSSTGKKVIANVQIAPQTVFGPLVAPLAEKSNGTIVYAFPSTEDGQLCFFQLDSELFSNWMRYVRFAENPAEENLAVYLRGSQVVFVSVRNILPGEELRVGYSAKYIKLFGRANGQSDRAENESLCVTVRSPGGYEITGEPKESAEMVPRKSTLRSATKAVVKTLSVPVLDHSGDSEENDCDWAPENNGRNESEESDCDMSSEQNSGRINEKPTSTTESVPVEMERLRSVGAPNGNGFSRSGFAGGQSGQSGARRMRAKEQKKECPVCHRVVFKVYGHLRKEHPGYASENFKHACETCGSRFPSVRCLHIHITKNHPAPPRAELPAEARQAAIDYMQKTGRLSYFCASCSKYFLKKSVLDIHELSHRVLRDHQGRPERSCPVCDFTGASFAELALHTAEHAVSAKARKQCLLCPDQVLTLPTHYKKNHPEYREIVGRNGQFQCPKCGMKCHSKHHLNEHLLTHDKMYNCLFCTQQFETPIALGKHNLTHQKDGAFPCPKEMHDSKTGNAVLSGDTFEVMGDGSPEGI